MNRSHATMSRRRHPCVARVRDQFGSLLAKTKEDAMINAGVIDSPAFRAKEPPAQLEPPMLDGRRRWSVYIGASC